MSVLLKCFKINNKLRIRIISPGYFNEHNCQFPRAVRIENTLYEVPIGDVSLVTSGGNKAFYRIKRANIRIVSEDHTPARDFKVFQDQGDDDCVVCMSEEKHYVFGPCGHFYVCKQCANKLKSCPICRSNIDFKVDYNTLRN